MATQLQLRGGTTAEHSTFTGASKEVTVDTDKNTVVVHDGSTAGGHPLVKESDVGTIAEQDANDVDITGGTVNATTLQQGSSQAYVRSNILGTVSQSGGVPTGAIIQRGSNANGDFVRYADGTQICTGVQVHDFNTDAPQSLLYPASFASIPVASASLFNLITSPDIEAIYNNQFYVGTETNRWRTRNVFGTQDRQIPFGLIAIGRWF